MRRDAAVGERRGLARFQRAVVSLEIALTVVLLVCGGLLARSLVTLFSVDSGFRYQHLAEVRVQLLRNRFPDAETRNSVLSEIIDAIETVPGVSRASGTSGLPFSGSGWMSDIEVEGHEADGDPLVSYRLVLPGFFEVMQIPSVSGRTLVDADHWIDPVQSVVVSETMAKRFWPHDNPVGKRVRFDNQWYVVVGAVGDVRHESLTSEYTPTVYVPVRTPTVSLVVRTEVEPQHLFPQIREAVRSVDPGAPILRMSTVKSLMTETATEERFRTVLLMTFALFAVLLGAAGVFGVTARSVSRRTKEMGIRMALGAQGNGLTRVVVWRGLSYGVIGMALGFPVALATTALLSPFLFGVERWDPLTYGAVASLMAVVCCLASYVPARRIAALDPVDVLRSE
jgi:predicted permease